MAEQDKMKWKYQRYMQDYLGTIKAVDENVGRLLDYLEANHLMDNTIIVYTSDQGFYLGEHGWFDKRFMYEESFRTPMVMRYPGVIKPGTENNNLLMNLDIAPTLLDAASVVAPDDMQGESFLPLLTKENAKGRKAMYYHYYENGEHSVSPHFGISTGRYKLIRFYKRVESWELYDLQNDASEMKNLYGNKKYKKLTEKLKIELLQLINLYDDKEAEKIFTEKIKE